MKKKRIAHNGETGISAMPCGYTVNASPGPAKFHKSDCCCNSILKCKEHSALESRIDREVDSKSSLVLLVELS